MTGSQDSLLLQEGSEVSVLVPVGHSGRVAYFRKKNGPFQSSNSRGKAARTRRRDALGTPRERLPHVPQLGFLD